MRIGFLVGAVCMVLLQPTAALRLAWERPKHCPAPKKQMGLKTLSCSMPGRTWHFNFKWQSSTKQGHGNYEMIFPLVTCEKSGCIHHYGPFDYQNSRNDNATISTLELKYDDHNSQNYGCCVPAPHETVKDNYMCYYACVTLMPECPKGFFGKLCGKECNCKSKNDTCNHITGACPSGCPPGWMGQDCQTECNPGTFGDMCKKKCHCKSGSSCNTITGVCPFGCGRGYTGTNCNSVCPKPFAPIGEGCYLTFPANRLQFGPAGELCSKVKGTLLNLNSKKEEDAVTTYLAKHHPDVITWRTGLSQRKVKGKWTWGWSQYPFNRKVMTYTNWPGGKPPKFYTMILKQTSAGSGEYKWTGEWFGSWRDLPKYQHAVICETMPTKGVEDPEPAVNNNKQTVDAVNGSAEQPRHASLVDLLIATILTWAVGCVASGQAQ